MFKNSFQQGFFLGCCCFSITTFPLASDRVLEPAEKGESGNLGWQISGGNVRKRTAKKEKQEMESIREAERKSRNNSGAH